mmetsp:Transcript_3823/g.10745  ORF Transcript_3823/g.10745 Transcript_3823/m.10745 type:complete len:256 (-) Transcript_3823:2967-3734(-)
MYIDIFVCIFYVYIYVYARGVCPIEAKIRVWVLGPRSFGWLLLCYCPNSVRSSQVSLVALNAHDLEHSCVSSLRIDTAGHSAHSVANVFFAQATHRSSQDDGCGACAEHPVAPPQHQSQQEHVVRGNALTVVSSAHSLANDIRAGSELRLRVHNMGSRFPVTQVLPSWTSARSGRLANSSGTVPEKSLEYKCSAVIDVSCPICEGIAPVIMLPPTSKNMRSVQFPNSLGSVPVSCAEKSLIRWRLAISPISVGSV